MHIEHREINEYFFGNAFSADDLFRDLSPETQKSLDTIKEEKHFKKNELVFANGQTPVFIYFLLHGDAQIFGNPKLDGKVLTRSVEPREILGLTEAIAGLPYETSVQTVSPCLFECIRCDDFIHFLQNEPESCFCFLQMLSTNIQKIYQLFARQQ